MTILDDIFASLSNNRAPVGAAVTVGFGLYMWDAYRKYQRAQHEFYFALYTAGDDDMFVANDQAELVQAATPKRSRN